MHSEITDSSTGHNDSRKSASTAVNPSKIQAIGYRSGESGLGSENSRSTERSLKETHERYLKPWNTSTLGKPRSENSSSSGYSSSRKSLSSKSSCSSNLAKIPLSTDQTSSSRGDQKNESPDNRYYALDSTYTLDSTKPPKKPLSCAMKDHDGRYYENSSYYR